MKHLNETPTSTPQNSISNSASTLPMYAPLLLLIRWILGWAAVEDMDSHVAERPVFRRRHQWLHDLQGISLPRRLRRRNASQIRRNAVRANDYIPFFSLLNDTKSKRDFNEKMTRVSAFGRIYLYGMRGYKLAALSKSTLTKDAIYAAAIPAGQLTNAGIWDAHAVPD